MNWSDSGYRATGLKSADQLINELLRASSTLSAMADFITIGFQEQLFLGHLQFRITLGDALDDFLEQTVAGHAVADGATKARSERELFLHGIGAMNIPVMFHIIPVIPGFADEMTTVGSGADHDIIRSGLQPAFNDGFELFVFHFILFKGQIINENHEAVLTVLDDGNHFGQSGKLMLVKLDDS